MTVRQLAHVPGHKAWICSCEPYLVPAGLVHGQVVTIIARAGQRVEVEDACGQRWTLQHWQVDSGTEWEVRLGQWVHESDPRMIAWFKRRIEKFRNERWQSPVDGARESTIARMVEIVARNSACSQESASGINPFRRKNPAK